MAQYEITTRRGVKTTAGGKIYELAWDPTSSRLVVSFADNNLIAVMQSVPTKAPNQFVDLIPLGYLRGPPDSGKPTFLTFCPTPPPFGALLSVVRSATSSEFNHSFLPFLIRFYLTVLAEWKNNLLPYALQECAETNICRRQVIFAYGKIALEEKKLLYRL